MKNNNNKAKKISLFLAILFIFLLPFFLKNNNKKSSIIGTPEIFKSSNPIYFSQILINKNLIFPQLILGYLSIPKIHTNHKIPLAILLTGSNGLNLWVNKYIKKFNNMGIATFCIDSFKSRGIHNTLYSQYSLPITMLVSDAYSALNFTSQLNYINKNKIFIVGWSKGGWVSNITAFSDIKNSFNKKIKFCAHIMIYPACKLIFPNYNTDKSPWLYIHGLKDDYTKYSNGKNLINHVRKHGVYVKCILYKDAYHGFDHTNQKLMWFPKIMNPTNCIAKLSKFWAATEKFSNIPLNTISNYRLAYKKCAKYGVHIGYNKKCSDDAIKQIMLFSKQYILSK